MKTNLDVDDVAPLDGGCPHCGSMTAHPTSSRPVAAPAPVKSKKKTEPSPAQRPDGAFAYELFVGLVGNKEVAVPWEKLTSKAQQVWTGVARGVERRTIDMLLLERARFERESKR
jgi:hypothetical protein